MGNMSGMLPTAARVAILEERTKEHSRLLELLDKRLRAIAQRIGGLIVVNGILTLVIGAAVTQQVIGK